MTSITVDKNKTSTKETISFSKNPVLKQNNQQKIAISSTNQVSSNQFKKYYILLDFHQD